MAAKGRRVFEEIERASHAFEVLGACVEDVYEFELSPEAEEHALILIKKIKPTPSSYPRRPGMPAKTPL